MTDKIRTFLQCLDVLCNAIKDFMHMRNSYQVHLQACHIGVICQSYLPKLQWLKWLAAELMPVRQPLVV